MGIFRIDADNFCWIDGSTDNAQDLCLHGDVKAQIGSVELKDTGTVSALVQQRTDDYMWFSIASG